MKDILTQLAPGQPLRDGIARIQRSNTGAIIVIGDGEDVTSICDGGFEFDVPFSATRLRELCKMDGAVIITKDASRIRRANVHLVPSREFPTTESGTRHRSAERAAQHTGQPVIAVSASLGIITIYHQGVRHVLEEPAAILQRANQAISTMERYRSRLDGVNQKLLSAELHDFATVSTVITVLRRELLLKRLGLIVDDYVIELGHIGQQIALQLRELRGTNDDDILMLLRDYLITEKTPTDDEVSAAITTLDTLTEEQLLGTEALAAALGIPATEEALTQPITPRGYRALSRIPRIREFQMDALVGEFGNLRGLLNADEPQLAAVEGVGSLWAGHIVDGLKRLAR